jgi:hypothetical protein
VTPGPFKICKGWRPKWDTALEFHGAYFKGLENCGTGYCDTCADLRSPRIFLGHNGAIPVASNAFFTSPAV